MDVSTLVARAREHLPGLLVATDFDGTLAPLVLDPEQSSPAPGALDALHGLAAAGARLAVITGRAAGTVVRLGGLAGVPGLVVEGLYGLEQWRDGTVTSPPEPPAVRALRAELPGVVAGAGAPDGVWIEDKRLSLVVHTRPAADPPAAQDRLRPAARALAERLGLELHDGRDVLEFRVPGYDKGAALRRLVELTRPGAVLFAGDDVGDLPAFAAVRDLGVPGWGVAAVAAGAPVEVRAAADVLVDGPSGVVDLLAAVASPPGRAG